MTRSNFVKAVSDVFDGFSYNYKSASRYIDEDGINVKGTERFLIYMEDRLDKHFYNIQSEFMIFKDEEEIYIYEVETMYSVNWYKLFHLGRNFSTNMSTGTRVYEFLKRLRDAIELDIKEEL